MISSNQTITLNDDSVTNVKNGDDGLNSFSLKSSSKMGIVWGPVSSSELIPHMTEATQPAFECDKIFFSRKLYHILINYTVF